LKLLKRYNAKDMGLALLPAWSGPVPESGRRLLRLDSSLKEILSEMMRHGLKEVPVEVEVDQYVRVSYEDLAGLLKEVSKL